MEINIDVLKESTIEFRKMPDEPNLTRRPIAYVPPRHWIRYSYASIAPILVEAKAAVLALVGSPYQRTWVEALQKIQLKREIAGTSKIEGADFTDRELLYGLKLRQTSC